MNEIKEAEVIVEDNALATVDPLSAMVKENEQPLLRVMNQMNSLDWRQLTPPQLALLIMQKPFQSQGGQLYLSFKQAILFATRCFELNLSPFSGEVWFNSNTGTVNVTLEGRKKIARNEGIDLGPPVFEEIYRPWESIPRMTLAAEEAKKAGFLKDVGVKCSMRVGAKTADEHASFIAYLSEWFVAKSPVWREKPLWMLSVRAQDKCISMALGTGVSDFQADE